MKLERIEIVGFRGIKRLSLSLETLSVLIGENAWGKTALLDALTIALTPTSKNYQFKLSDFHVDHSQNQSQFRQLNITLQWREDRPNEHKMLRYQSLNGLWLPKKDQRTLRKTLCHHITAHIEENNRITTHYGFLNRQGQWLPNNDYDSNAIESLRSLFPLIRLRDARRLRSPARNEASTPQQRSLEKRFENTYRRLLNTPGHVNSGEIKSSIRALSQLLEHYFSFSPHTKKANRLPQATPFSLFQTDKLSRQSRLILMSLLNAYIRAYSQLNLPRLVKPLMILEDPEGRLHPINLHQAWLFIEQLPVQSLITTNSPDLLSVVPFSHIQKLKPTADGLKVHRLNPNLLQKSERRKIEFHLRLSRPNALFARAWLLVEGETEIWLFNQLAHQFGYHFLAEGIQVMPFAQSGLKPLINIAQQLGIEWHVLTDGDFAGKQYANTVKKILSNHHPSPPLNQRLTILPAPDIEHFLFQNGFESVFRALIHAEKDQKTPNKKLLMRAIKRHAKPDIALAVVQHAQQMPNEKLPLLLRWLIKRIVNLARGQHN